MTSGTSLGRATTSNGIISLKALLLIWSLLLFQHTEAANFESTQDGQNHVYNASVSPGTYSFLVHVGFTEFYTVWYINGVLDHQDHDYYPLYTDPTMSVAFASGTNSIEADVWDSTGTKFLNYHVWNITVPPLPDLTKNNDSLNNSNPRPGDTITATLTVTNQPCTSGSAAAGAFHVGFYWSTTSTFSGVSPFYEAPVNGCAANRSVSVNQPIYIDPSTTPGTYYLGYKIDDENEVGECNGNNNGIYFWTITVQPTLADLIPQNSTVIPNNAIAGATVTINYTITNSGGTTTPASHTKLQIKDASNTLLTQQIFDTASIPAISAIAESRTLSLSNAVPGTYYTYVIVDNNNEVNQSIYTNDFSSGVPFTIQSGAGLIINPTFDTSITSDPNSSTIQSSIYSAIANYETRFADPIVVNIKFQEVSNGLGESSWYYFSMPYSQFLNALRNDNTSTNDTTALTLLPLSTSNPVTLSSTINLKPASCRAIGFGSSNSPNGFDGIISLNTSIMNLSRPPIDSSKYDLMATVEHEIDEVLGLGSALGHGLEPFPEDLFRYTSGGTRSFTTSGDDAYFSIDGKTLLARFNQYAAGDYGDWWSTNTHSLEVQDAFGTPGSTPDLGVELRALDVIGYDYTAAVSPPRIQSIIRNGNAFSFTWSAVSNRTYQVQFKTNLTQSAWLNLGSATKATGPLATATDTISNAQRLYRVTLTQTVVQNSLPHAAISGPFGPVTNHIEIAPQ